MSLELADRSFADVDEPGFGKRVAEGLRVVDEAVSPGAEEVVHDRAREWRIELRVERVGGPTEVTPLHLVEVLGIQRREAFQRRSCDANAARGLQHAQALAQASLPLRVCQMLAHVLGEDE